MARHRKFALVLGCLAAVFYSSTSLQAGHTRAPYVDGCQSMDGRFVVTAAVAKNDQGKDQWQFTWKDSKTGQTHKGWLVGHQTSMGHFEVCYAHIFVAPDGETFAVWNGGSFADSEGRKALSKADKSSDAFRGNSGFADRLVVYKKTGEILRRVALKDILKAEEWKYVYWVHGNLYWSAEYPDAATNSGEAPRAGIRYFRVSPDYTVLEVAAGPCLDASHQFKAEGPAVYKYQRVVRFDLTTGKEIDPSTKIVEVAKIPVRPFAGKLITRDQGHAYVPSLDPIRVAGVLGESKRK